MFHVSNIGARTGYIALGPAWMSLEVVEMTGGWGCDRRTVHSMQVAFALGRDSNETGLV